MSVLDLARPELLTLAAYPSARRESGQAGVMLNANESPWPPPGDGQSLNRYPQPQPEPLCERLAQLYDVSTAQLLIGLGSDEGIDLLLRAFCRSGQDAIAICPPTFGMYAMCANVQGAGVVELPLQDDYLPDLRAVRDIPQRWPAVKLVFLCSPGNPSGALLPLAAIEDVLIALAGHALVVVDEAYIEYADSSSAISLLDRYPHLAVLRTLSKAWALAGARIGALLAHADVIELLRRIMPPYPLPTPCVAAALHALDDAGHNLMRERVGRIVAERERMARALLQLPGVREVLPSAANFLCVRFADSAKVHAALCAHGIVVRDVARYPALQQCLRLSIGSVEENDRVLAVLAAGEVAA